MLQYVDISYGVDLPNDYQDEIAMMSLSQIVDTIQLDSFTPTATSEASTIEIFDIVQTRPISNLFNEDVSLTDDVLEGTVSSIVVVSDFVDSPNSFDVFSSLSSTLMMYLLILHI